MKVPRGSAWGGPALLLVMITVLPACLRPSPETRATGLPEWTGVWLAMGLEMDIDGFTPINPEAAGGVPPPVLIFSPLVPWNDAGRARVEALMKTTNGDPGNRANGSSGWGYPAMMAGPAPVQFAITPSMTLIFNQYRDLRVIHTDGRGHQPAEEGWPPTTWGDSIGHWEGDTLVIDTIGVRNPREYLGIASPFSDRAHYVERLRLVAPDRIEGEMTIEDPDTLSGPLHFELSYLRSKDVDRLMPDAFSNDRSGYDGEFNTIEPTAKR